MVHAGKVGCTIGRSNNFIGVAEDRWLTLRVSAGKTNLALTGSLLVAIAFWGGNNAGAKLLVASWPPVWTGGTRFLIAGLLLLTILRWTRFYGNYDPPTREQRRLLWLRSGLILAAYVVSFNWAVKLTSVAHIAIYLGATPVWALLIDRSSARGWRLLQKYFAALLALGGVGVLFAPALKSSQFSIVGEALGLAASWLWTAYSWQCRELTATLNSVEVTAQTMWRAGAWLLPVGLVEVAQAGLPLKPGLFLIQGYCIIAGGVVAFGIWNNALRYWPPSKVMLFNNFVPISTMIWAHYWLGESVTATFWIAMGLVATGVTLGQINIRLPQKAVT